MANIFAAAPNLPSGDMQAPQRRRFRVMKANPPARMETRGRGDGEISEDAIARRAEELARMDGRPKASEQDRFHAREELANPGPAPAPEADESVQPAEKWSMAAASQGHEGPHGELEDEQSAAEQLVAEGIEEADHDQRVAASEEVEEEP